MQEVAVVAGSKSDNKLVEVIEQTLEKFGIGYESFIISAHRTPEKCTEFSISAKDKGFKVIIAVAGLAAHLPGVIASQTLLPVIGVPATGGPLNGIDALLSIVQMPGSTPVATMALGKAGAKNAAIMAARILALSDINVANKLNEYRKELKSGGK